MTAFIDHSRSDYTMNSTIVGVEEADRIVIIGCNPRYEAPLVNARIRKAWLHAETEVDVIGSEVNLSYTYNYHGNDPQSEYKLKIQSKNDLFSFDTNCKWYTQSRRSLERIQTTNDHSRIISFRP